MQRICNRAASSMATVAKGALSHSSQPAAPRVAVVGGGMAGLSAAQALLRHNVSTTLFDMGGRGPGGRVASRQFEQQDFGALSFDHGAQFITARSPEFQRQLAEWQAAGVVQEWQARHSRITQDGTLQLSSHGADADAGFCGSLTGQPLYVGLPTNNALCKHLAQQLQQQHPQAATLNAGYIVKSVARAAGGCGCGSGGWQLKGSRQGRAAAAAGPAEPDAQEDFGSFDAVVLADAMPLLPGSAGHISGIEEQSSSLAQLARSVRDAAPQPCFALMLAFREPLRGVPFDSASISTEPSGSSSRGSSGSRGSTSAFHWVACNSSKPGRPQAGGSTNGAPQCWVALTSPQRTQQLLDAHPLTVGGRFNPQTQQYQAAVAAELLADFRALMQPFVEGPVPDPAYCHAQRWGRAFVAQPLGTELLFLPAQRLAVCGDVAAGSSIEAAWRSGRAAGDAVAAMLASAGTAAAL